MDFNLDFLEAPGTPLTKRFTKNGTTTDVDPYPFVKNFTSYRERITSLEDLSTKLQEHAKAERCLLKGLLKRPIENESRAGMTASNDETWYLVLDLDFEDGWNSVDEFLTALNPEWSDVSYVHQHSASAGIKGKAGLRGHIWICLDQPVAPAMIKMWLKERNLRVSLLSERMELAANGLSAKWPLDLTTCQNDKLIYIAPPQCVGFDDPLNGDRFTLVKKDRDQAPAPKLQGSPASIDAESEKRIAKMREDCDLPKAKAKTKTVGAETILTNPDKAVISSVKSQRGFVYLNLNGGDSWAYFFPENNPSVVHNFKGEPSVYLKDIAPDFYRQYTDELDQQREEDDVQPYVFREPDRDAYYNVSYLPKEDRFDQFSTASGKEKLKDFMGQYGRPLPDYIPDWKLEFNPSTTKVIDAKKQWINMYEPTDFIRGAHLLTAVDELPPVTEKIIDSICGDDEEVKHHFLNWLAYIFQTRKRTETSWIFHGVQGTGKGLLLNKILRPLIGENHVTEWTTQNLEEQFNAALEHTCLLWLDEFQASSARQAHSVMNKLKSYITENEVTIRAMRTNGVQRTNWLNVIIATNHPDPIQLTEHDRRFNVAPAQEEPLIIKAEDVAAIPDELPMFASYLHNLEVDEVAVRRPLLNQARQQMIAASQTTTERFFTATRDGDLNWFMDFQREEIPVDGSHHYSQFDTALHNWARYASKGQKAPVTRDQLMSAYSAIIGSNMTQAKFARMCYIHRIPLDPINTGNKTIQGTHVEWEGDTHRINELLENSKDAKLKVVNEA